MNIKTKRFVVTVGVMTSANAKVVQGQIEAFTLLTPDHV